MEASVCCSDDYGRSTNGNFLWRLTFFIMVQLWNITNWHLLFISCPTSTVSTSELFFMFMEVTCMLCTAAQKDHEIFWQISWRISGRSPPNSQKMLGFGFLNLKFLSIHTHKCTHSDNLEFIYTCVIKKKKKHNPKQSKLSFVLYFKSCNTCNMILLWSMVKVENI